MSAVIDLSRGTGVVVQGDNAEVLPRLPDGSFQLVYIDPPFNTGGRRDRRTLRTVREEPDGGGDRTGFGGRRYSTVETGRMSYPDSFADYAGSWRPGWRRPAGCSPTPGPSTCTWTGARRTTARCCSTTSSAATASSTR